MAVEIHRWGFSSPPASAVLAVLLSGCAAPSLVCGDGQYELDLSSPTGDFLYTDAALPVMAIDMDQEALDGLARSSREDLPDVHATFVFQSADGPETYDVGLHLKGHSSFRPIEEKAAFKIDFGEWVDGGAFHGVRRLTLNNMNGDPSMISEHLSYRVYGLVGLPAARHGYACVVVNGADYGLYGVLETMDQQFLDRAFAEPDGNLYEATFGADVSPSSIVDLEEEVINDVTDRSDLAALAAAFQDVTPDNTLEHLGAHFDLEELLDGWAVELMIGNHDGYAVMRNNYLLYHQPGAGRWSFLPWGMDESFSETSDNDLSSYLANEGNFGGLLFRYCLASPDCFGSLEEHLLDIAALFEDEDMGGYADGLVDRVRDVSRGDDMSPATSFQTRRAQKQKTAWIEDRGQQVSSQLAD